FGRDLERACEGGAGRDADKDAFLRRQLLGTAKRFGTRNRQDAVDELHRHRIAGDLWNEVGCPALHRMRLEARMSRGRRAVRVPLLLDVATEQLRILRLA